ncbi:S4 domain-containing protein [Terricaulis sp.]|uniref:S4 domain-containing protein n=1 Tax=Terricaulis sp. TaxID=2768686 RepID=UPI00378500CD
MSALARQRVDLWLVRARFVKTRAAAARLVSEGGVRIIRDGGARLIDKPSVEVAVGDGLTFPNAQGLLTVRIEALPQRRGPPAEARGLYSKLDAGSCA